SGVGLPLTAGGEILGVVDFYLPTHEQVDDQLIEVLRAIGGHLGQFVQNSNTQERLRWDADAAKATSRELVVERETLAKLNEAGRTIGAELDQQALVQAVVDVATQITGAQI